MFMFCVQVSAVGYSIINCLLDGGLGCGGQSEIFVSKAVDENVDGLDV
jgi:hypothetical protein